MRCFILFNFNRLYIFGLIIKYKIITYKIIFIIKYTFIYHIIIFTFTINDFHSWILNIIFSFICNFLKPSVISCFQLTILITQTKYFFYIIITMYTFSPVIKTYNSAIHIFYNKWKRIFNQFLRNITQCKIIYKHWHQPKCYNWNIINRIRFKENNI